MAIGHRIGELDIGEASVIVAVATPHRDAAFEAARIGIDTIKERVPIWKKEVVGRRRELGGDSRLRRALAGLIPVCSLSGRLGLSSKQSSTLSGAVKIVTPSPESLPVTLSICVRGRKLSLRTTRPIVQ